MKQFKTLPSSLDHVVLAGASPEDGSVKSAFLPEENQESAVYVGCRGIIEKILERKEQDVANHWTAKC